jgi:hypothetical protein
LQSEAQDERAACARAESARREAEDELQALRLRLDAATRHSADGARQLGDKAMQLKAVEAALTDARCEGDRWRVQAAEATEELRRRGAEVLGGLPCRGL